MTNYIDGFIFPIAKSHIDQYKKVAAQVAEIWKEHGADAYCEYVGDEMNLEGTKSFRHAIDANENEVVIFGWVVFPSKEIRNLANEKVPLDPRIKELVGPITDSKDLIFDARRMVYAGFKPLVP